MRSASDHRAHDRAGDHQAHGGEDGQADVEQDRAEVAQRGQRDERDHEADEADQGLDARPERGDLRSGPR
jgi:hypothetical protein